MNCVRKAVRCTKPSRVFFGTNEHVQKYGSNTPPSCRAYSNGSPKNVSFQTARPRRSLLFVPADDKKKITKATNLKADCIVLECEDGVAMNQKVFFIYESCFFSESWSLN